MLRYGNRAYCIGFHDVSVRSAGFSSWQRADEDAVLILMNTQQHRFPTEHWLQLQFWNPTIGKVERDVEFPIRSKIGSVALSENEDVLAITRGHWIDSSGEVLLYSLESSQPQSAF